MVGARIGRGPSYRTARVEPVEVTEGAELLHPFDLEAEVAVPVLTVRRQPSDPLASLPSGTREDHESVDGVVTARPVGVQVAVELRRVGPEGPADPAFELREVALAGLEGRERLFDVP